MSNPRRPRVAIYFRMFGPYILARIAAAAQRLDVIGIEGSRRSSVYAWEPDAAETPFDRRTLFSDGVLEQQPVADAIAATRAALDATQPDVVCVTGWSHSEALTALGWAREHGRHAILLSESTAADADRVRAREWIKRWIVRQCDAALVGGEPQRAYAERLGMAPEGVFIGYDAVDNAFFAERAAVARADAAAVRARLELPERYFLASCRFIEKKNLARLIEAFAAYRAATAADPWDLVLIGDGELRSALEQQVARAGLTSAVRFLGFRQYDELPSFYGCAGGFVHVSTVEQWGLVVNEAMASALPVIVSTRVGCAEDLVAPGGNGWTVDPRDVGDIARRLTQLAGLRDDERSAMGQRSAAIVAEYGPDRFGEGLAAAVAFTTARPARRSRPLTRWLLARLAARDTRGGF